MFKGVITALVTPFRNDAVDEEALRRLVDEQIRAGVDGLVPVGTTGESPTVTVEEHIRIIKIVVEETRTRVPVIAGTGANATREAIELNFSQQLKSGALVFQPVNILKHSVMECLFPQIIPDVFRGI